MDHFSVWGGRLVGMGHRPELNVITFAGRFAADSHDRFDFEFAVPRLEDGY